MAENTKIIISAVDKTKSGFNSATKGLKAITATVFSLKTALISVAGVGGFGYLIKSSLDATDSLKKTADKIGTTTEALGALRYAAEVSGVETRTLDMAMQRFTRRLSEAAKGTGEAKGALQELGIDARSLQKIPLDEQMIILSDAFSNVATDADKVRLAFKLFDSEGVALVNTLGLGREELSKMLGEARALGLTMSATAAKGVEDTNDALLKLRGLFKGVTDQTVAAMAPAMEMLVTRFTAFLQRTIEVRGGVEKFAKSLAVDLLSSIKVALYAFEDLANGFIKVYNTSVSIKNSLKDTFGLGLKSAAEYREELNSIDKQMKGIKNASMDPSKQLEVIDLLIARREEALKLYHEAQDAESDVPASSISFAARLAGELDVLIASLNNTKQTIAELPQAVVPELNAIQLGFKSWSDAIPDLQTNLENLTKQGLDGLTDALTAGITGAANFADAIKAMAKSVVDSLIKMLIQKYIVDAAFGAITAGFSQASTNVAGGYSATMGDPFSGKAIGGSVQSGQTYMVGERGPEMFVPNQQGSIVPNNKLSGGDGVVINQTINVTTGVQQTVRAEIATLMPQIANAAKSAVADARMRGGSYSKMLVGA